MSKILIVDDEPKSVELLKNRLEEAGHCIAGAGCFKEGAERLSRELFDLLITDVRLPDRSAVHCVLDDAAIDTIQNLSGKLLRPKALGDISLKTSVVLRYELNG